MNNVDRNSCYDKEKTKELTIEVLRENAYNILYRHDIET
jgi:hypothetical protein